MSEIIQEYNLLGYLQEIEKVTDLNGCFFINAKDDIVIESTIPFRVPDEILWEIGVLRDTFRQFSNGINHGKLNELMIEGSKGYILLYDIPPHLLLLALGSDDMNLSYVRLAMIDILKRSREEIAKIGDNILKIPGKELGALGVKEGIVPTLVTTTEPLETQPHPPSIEVPPEIEAVEKEPVISQAEMEPIEPEPLIAEKVDIGVIKTELVESVEEPSFEEKLPTLEIVEESLEGMIKSLENKELKERYQTLESIFDGLKAQLEEFTGNELSKLLEQLKDAILLNIGTSLALFDISKAEKELNKLNRKLGIAEIQQYKNRIDNWSSRIIKI